MWYARYVKFDARGELSPLGYLSFQIGVCGMLQKNEVPQVSPWGEFRTQRDTKDSIDTLYIVPEGTADPLAYLGKTGVTYKIGIITTEGNLRNCQFARSVGSAVTLARSLMGQYGNSVYLAFLRGETEVARIPAKMII